MFDNVYKNKKVFITGHTGFKGSWLSVWLNKLGAKICGYSIDIPTKPSMFEELNISDKIYKSITGDILDEKKLMSAISDFQPDIVFHLAAQPLVIKSYNEPVLTYKTNVIGSLNVLQFANSCSSVKAFVNITTDKCYKNLEKNYSYKETDMLGGYDMYSSSKACVEIMSESFRQSFLNNDNSMAMATARAGNVIGGGDWAENRLVPDCIRHINLNMPIKLRNPLSIRPWQHVLEPLSGYLLLGQKLLQGGKVYAESFNFGPHEESFIKVGDVVSQIINYYGTSVNIEYDKEQCFHEANLLMLNIDKAKNILNWEPTYTIKETIFNTAEWYKHFYQKDVDMFEYTLRQIDNFEQSAKWNK